MEIDEGGRKSGRVVPPAGWLTVPEAAKHAGVSQNTMRRKVDAWLGGTRTAYAARGALVWGGRLVDQVDAERVRLQRHALLDVGVDAEQWAEAVRADQLPVEVRRELTDASWWPAAVGRLRERPPPTAG